MDRAIRHPRTAHSIGSLPLPGWALILVVSSFQLALVWSSNQVLLTLEMTAAVLGEQMDPAQIERMFTLAKRYEWLGYATVLPALLLRVTIVAACLQLAMLLFEEVQVRFAAVFRITLIANLMVMCESMVYVGWLSLLDSSERVARAGAGNPFSLAVLFDPARQPLLHQLAEFASLGQAIWLGTIVLLLSAETPRPAGSVAVTCTLVWATISATQFTAAQLLFFLY